MGKIKCKECLGCMDYVWVDNRRFLYCAFCRTYFTGIIGELYQVESPYLTKCPECLGEKYVPVHSIECKESGDVQKCSFCKGTGKIDRRTINAGN